MLERVTNPEGAIFRESEPQTLRVPTMESDECSTKRAESVPEAVKRLSKDLALASRTISDAELRFLVDAYYQLQDGRIRAAGQVRSIEGNPVNTGKFDQDGNPITRIEPHDDVDMVGGPKLGARNPSQASVGKYVDGHVVGSWLLGVCGIGPGDQRRVAAHIDIKKAPTAGHIWRFAGLRPDGEMAT